MASLTFCCPLSFKLIVSHSIVLYDCELQQLVSCPCITSYPELSNTEQRLHLNACAHKVFVAGVKTSITEADLREAFQKFGRVTKVSIMLDLATGCKRGFGFVIFKTLEACEAAILAKRVQVKHSKVSVKPSKPQFII